MEEMDAMDSSSDNGSEDSDESVEREIEEISSCINDLEELQTACDDKGCAQGSTTTLEWSQFMNSTEGMLQYLAEATATIQDVSSLVIPSPSQEQSTRDSTTAVKVADHEQGCLSPGVLFSTSSNKTQIEPMILPGERLPRLLRTLTTNFTVTAEPSTAPSLAGQRGPTTAGLSVPQQHIPSQCSVPDRPGSTESRAPVTEQAGVNESDRRIVVAGIPPQSVLAKESFPPRSASGSPGRHAGHEPTPNIQDSAKPLCTTGLLTPTLSNQSVIGDDASVPGTPFPLVDKRERNALQAMTSESKLPRASRVFETSDIPTSQPEGLSEQVKSEFARVEGGIPGIADAISQIDVMASVGESEVARRIRREKARHVEARQKRRKDSMTK